MRFDARRPLPVITALVAAGLCLAPAPAARAFEQSRSTHGARVRLMEGPARVRLAAPVPGISDGGTASLRQAMATWAAPSCTSLRFVLAEGGEPADIEVRVVSEGWRHGQTIAAHTDVESDPRTGSMKHATIELNAALRWAAGDGANPEALDLESVLLHELGHAIGLAHARDMQAVMRAGTKPGVLRRALGEDDVAGVCAIYPMTGDKALAERRGGWSGLAIIAAVSLLVAGVARKESD
jgi:predicted Zn-dependent protease